MRVLTVVAGLVALVPLCAGAADAPYHTRIPHRDGSGRATIVEIDPGVPGAKAFVRDDDDRPAPGRGELSLPLPTPLPLPSIRPSPSR